MSTATPYLDIRELVSLFETREGVVRAVDGVTLSVHEGRVLGIVGESGSGKTQTFYGVLGLSRGAPGVVNGAARIGSVDVLADLPRYVHEHTDANGRRRLVRDPAWRGVQAARLAPVLGHEVAILFQDPRRSLIPYWTVGRHLDEVLQRDASLSARARHERAEDQLRTLGFSDVTRIRHAYPEQLSGGEAQRAMLALTMTMRPRLLIADEPTTGLDTVNQALALESLTALHDRVGMAMVIISHDLGVIDATAQDMVVMYGGRVLAQAPTRVMRSVPAEALHPYARELRESRDRRTRGAPIVPGGAGSPAARATTGCAFRLRCQLFPRLSDAHKVRCSEQVPPLLPGVGDGHEVACWGVTGASEARAT